jgi:hypothetical protein
VTQQTKLVPTFHVGYLEAVDLAFGFHKIDYAMLAPPTEPAPAAEEIRRLHEGN